MRSFFALCFPVAAWEDDHSRLFVAVVIGDDSCVLCWLRCIPPTSRGSTVCCWVCYPKITPTPPGACCPGVLFGGNISPPSLRITESLGVSEFQTILTTTIFVKESETESPAIGRQGALKLALSQSQARHQAKSSGLIQVDLLKCVHEGAPQVKLASLSSGDIFGESAMIQGGSRSATVRCATQVQARQSKYAELEFVDDDHQPAFTTSCCVGLDNDKSVHI